MPLRVIKAPGHSISTGRTLGWLAIWWIETFTVHGPGDVMGVPVKYGDEMSTFIADCYALDKVGRRLYDSAFLSRPKGCDKSGIAAALALFEALGPARFAGFALGGETYEFLGKTYTYSRGEPMGRRVKSPFIRVMATEEGQTGNVFDTIYLNLTDSAVPLFALKAYGLVAGQARISLPWGGVIQASTSTSASKDGGIETFVVYDESHLYKTPNLRGMFRTVSKNLRKRKQIAETWYIETTTMYAPGEESIAEETYALADAVQEGRVLRPRMYFNHRWGEILSLGDPVHPSTEESREIHELELGNAFRDAYGDAIAFNSVEALIDGAFDTRQSEAETRRYFLNALTSSVNSWFEVQELADRGRRHLARLEELGEIDGTFTLPAKGDVVTLGFDGSSTNDATALVACRVSDGYLFPLLIVETPDGPEALDYEVDRDGVDAAVYAAFGKFTVVGFFADPPLWQDYVDKWGREHEDELKVKSSQKHAIGWWTNRTYQMSVALERLHTAIITGESSYDDVSQLGMVMTRHFQNARMSRRRGGDVITKETKNSAKKIDAGVAATLAFEARAAFLALGKSKPKKRTFVPVRVR